MLYLMAPYRAEKKDHAMNKEVSDLLKAAYTRVLAVINNLTQKLPHGTQEILDKYSGGEWVEIYKRDMKE